MELLPPNCSASSPSHRTSGSILRSPRGQPPAVPPPAIAIPTLLDRHQPSCLILRSPPCPAGPSSFGLPPGPHLNSQRVNDILPTLILKIIHVYMDAFFASARARFRTEAGLSPSAERLRGVVAAASYEARKFGIRSAMPSVTARRRCPDLIFVKPRFDAYRTVSRQIRNIFADYSACVEPLSLDEAYLDVTHDLKGIGIATRIAEEIRARIFAETALTASAGVSYNFSPIGHDQNTGGLAIPPQRESFRVAPCHQALQGSAERCHSGLGIETGVTCAP